MTIKNFVWNVMVDEENKGAFSKKKLLGVGHWQKFFKFLVLKKLRGVSF